MSLFEVLIESLESLSANKLRSGLTILGIVIGVGAVIAMLSVGQGAQSSITGTISDVGTNLLFIFSGNDEMYCEARDILAQFLTESSMLSLIGGLVGILLGWLIAYLIEQIAAASNVAFHPIVGMDAIMLATIFSASVGLFFGIYPANRAANLEPVDALRYE